MLSHKTFNFNISFTRKEKEQKIKRRSIAGTWTIAFCVWVPKEIENLKMEDELNGVVPCSSLAVESTIRVGTVNFTNNFSSYNSFAIISSSKSFFPVHLQAGALWGLCMGPYNSRKNGNLKLRFQIHILSFDSFIAIYLLPLIRFLSYRPQWRRPCCFRGTVYLLFFDWDCSILAFVRSEIASLWSILQAKSVGKYGFQCGSGWLS